MTVKVFSADYLDSLVEEASQSPRARQHRNIHERYDEPCQRLLNAIGTDSYIRPHRHSRDPKAETLIAVRGRFAFFSFGDNGEMHEIIQFGAGAAEDCSVGVEISSNTWHTIIALSESAVVLEVKAGPFNPSSAKMLANWAPVEGTPESMEYLKNLYSKVKK